ncbi:Uncharacterised protein [Neisseria subflava]|uniref:Uncharacterized protein n=1 Tax=Neisseria subflava TaxID=28449 RepID=A0A9X9R0D9_NEISU|nr:hypothetical protein [Neisseria subflava]VTY09885.1 Uncharacterised protein [Neisseria subflava]
MKITVPVKPIIILILSVSGLLIPVFFIYPIIASILVSIVKCKMIKRIIKYIEKNLYAILSNLILVLTALFIYYQAQFAKEATIPNLVVSVFNDEERKGLYVTNFGKGHAIVDSIQINQTKHETITKKIWNSTLKNLGINAEAHCFSWSPIQKNIVLRAGETNILLGQRQSVSNLIKNTSRNLQEQNLIDRINKLNQLVLEDISNSENVVNGKDIVSKFNNILNEYDGLQKELQKDNSNNECEEINKQFMENHGKEIIKKLDNIEITIFYHSIIDDKSINSKRLLFEMDDK